MSTAEIDKTKSRFHTSTISGSNSRYAIFIEKTATGFSAFVPDLPGCIATAQTKAQIEKNMIDAIRLHIDGLVEDGLPVPDASSIGDRILE